MSKLTNPHDFSVWVHALQRSLKPGEVTDVEKDVADALTRTGVLTVAEDIAKDVKTDAKTIKAQAKAVAADVKASK